MTKEEFEALYASRSFVTVEELHRYGRIAVPCECGDDLCEGWQMVRNPETEEAVRFGRAFFEWSKKRVRLKYEDDD